MSEHQLPTAAQFETGGPSWAERATLGELRAAIHPTGTEQLNRYYHGVESYGAELAASLISPGGHILDFGCGPGRFVRYFGSRGFKVTGTDITAEMLLEARRTGLPGGANLVQTDGVAIPLPDASLDLIWVCGVLKFSLFPPGSPCRGDLASQSDRSGGNRPFTPVYENIGREMYRVLKPGRFVVNVEMYVDMAPDPFLSGFQAAGFITQRIHVLHRHCERLERLSQARWFPMKCAVLAGRWTAAYNVRTDDPMRTVHGFRDYLFVWVKPA